MLKEEKYISPPPLFLHAFISPSSSKPPYRGGVLWSRSCIRARVIRLSVATIEMFGRVNVRGAMSGALTTGDTLTGSTSGATGTIEGISVASSATITGATVADPVVVTCSGGHNLTEGQQITIANVVGMTDINTNHTVKNPTATTFELFTASAATGTPTAVDGTGYTA